MIELMLGRVRARFFKSPKAILNACIRDIDRGMWICGELAEDCNVKKEEPMGCAIGLVGINSGAGWVEKGETGMWYSLEYPYDINAEDNGGWSKGAKDAIIALAHAVPHEWLKARYPHSHMETDVNDGPTACDVVIGYNDGKLGVNEEQVKPDTAEARAWFQRAVDAL